jgi:hypothetical protein
MDAPAFLTPHFFHAFLAITRILCKAIASIHVQIEAPTNDSMIKEIDYESVEFWIIRNERT